MFSIFSQEVQSGLKALSFSKLQEIRIRNGRKVKIRYDNKSFFLSTNGATLSSDKAIVAENDEAREIVLKAANYSVYAVNDMIKRGYIPLKNGARLGLCGEWVSENGAIKTVKTYNSVCLRVPHEVFGCSKKVFSAINFSDDCYGLLVASLPGKGKTTLIRDIARVLSGDKNVLIVDERFEIAALYNDSAGLEVGDCDVICGIDKMSAIKSGIRACAPDYIVTDEISEEDYSALYYAKTCGIRIVATIHAEGLGDLKRKQSFGIFLENKIFSHYVVLSRERLGDYKVYNAEMELL